MGVQPPWSVCLLADWTGPTYNYETQNKAVNDGRIQRSDRRGLIVRVRGQLCVLEAAACFYDDVAKDTTINFRSDDTDQNENPDLDDAEMEEDALTC